MTGRDDTRGGPPSREELERRGVRHAGPQFMDVSDLGPVVGPRVQQAMGHAGPDPAEIAHAGLDVALRYIESRYGRVVARVALRRVVEEWEL